MFCKAPFISQFLIAYGVVMMCCNDGGTNVHSSMEEEWNSESRKAVRIAMLNGEIPDRCKKCVSLPGENSDRHTMAQFYNEMGISEEDIIASCSPDGTMNILPTHIQVAPSNKCQLACRMCNAESSDMYGKTYKVKSTSKVCDNDAIEAYIMKCAPTLEQYTFHGGEPFLSPMFNRIMEKLVPYDNIEFEIRTNGMSLKSCGVDVIHWLNKIKRCFVVFSIDGTKEVTQYQRSFSDFDRIIANMKRLHEEAPHIGIFIQHVASNVTTLDLPAFYRYVHDELPFVGGIWHEYVDNPIEYAAWNLPYGMRDNVIAGLTEVRKTIYNTALLSTIDKGIHGLKTIYKNHEFSTVAFKEFLELDKQKSICNGNTANLTNIMKIRC